MLIVMTTVPDLSEAGTLSEKIVSERLAACVQILPAMMSVYVWQGAIQRESEHLLLIKTLEDRFEPLRDFILANHSYETPEIVSIAAESVSDGYLAWMMEYLTASDAE